MQTTADIKLSLIQLPQTQPLTPAKHLPQVNPLLPNPTFAAENVFLIFQCLFFPLQLHILVPPFLAYHSLCCSKVSPAVLPRVPIGPEPELGSSTKTALITKPIAKTTLMSALRLQTPTTTPKHTAIFNSCSLEHLFHNPHDGVFIKFEAITTTTTTGMHKGTEKSTGTYHMRKIMDPSKC